MMSAGQCGFCKPARTKIWKMQQAGLSDQTVADAFIQETLEGDHKFVGHACEFETSMMLHVRPELLVREKLADAGTLVTDSLHGVFLSRDMQQRTREGYTGRPDLASVAKGERLFGEIVNGLASLVTQLLSEPLGTEYSDFVLKNEP